MRTYTHLVKVNHSLFNVVKSLLSGFEVKQEPLQWPFCCWFWPLRSHLAQTCISLPAGSSMHWRLQCSPTYLRGAQDSSLNNRYPLLLLIKNLDSPLSSPKWREVLVMVTGTGRGMHTLLSKDFFPPHICDFVFFYRKGTFILLLHV